MKSNREIIKRALGVALFEAEKVSKEVAGMNSISCNTKAKIIHRNNKEVEEYIKVLKEVEGVDNYY